VHNYVAEVKIVQNTIGVVATAVGHRVVRGHLVTLGVARPGPWDLVLATARQTADDAIILGIAIGLRPVDLAVLRVA